MGEMWHANAEWHDNYGDKVKIETDKYDGLETKNCSLVVLALSPVYVIPTFWPQLTKQLYNLLTEVLARYIYAQLPGRIYSRAIEMAGSICLKL